MTRPVTPSRKDTTSLASSAMPPGATQSIGSSLAEVLRDRIVTGNYPPGMWIRESALAEEFGYSNGPIREALQLLVGEELLVREPWRGVRVIELNGEEIVEIFQLRAALLDLAVELAAQRISTEQLEVGRQLLQKLEEALSVGDLRAQLSLGNALNLWVCDCSGNARLAQNWNRFTSQTRIYFHTALRNSTDPHEVSEPWRELVDALERRDVMAARTVARQLVRRPLKGLGLPSGL